MKRDLPMDIFRAALAAADPHRAVKKAIERQGSRFFAGTVAYDLDSFDRVVVVGAGKATARMALALEESLGSAIDKGLVIVKYGHTATLKKIEQREASHPLPDEAGMQATGRILELVRSADERTLVICLLSGGASSLLVRPAPGITLEGKQNTTRLLLEAGASIEEVNCVRKHLSSVKGGRLAQAAYPAPVLALILSDVIGDPLDVIASGPTAPDGTTFREAAAVIEKYGLRHLLPPQVAAFLERGAAGREPETAKHGDPCFLETRNHIVGGIDIALNAARDRASATGLACHIATSGLKGEARDAARTLALMALEKRNALKPGERYCLLSGGETTVTVRGPGTGGRNQELALAFAVEIDGVPGITLLSAGTDGTDGPTDAAGAIVDGETVKKARQAGIDPEAYLGRNDSYSFFRQYDSLTGEASHLLTGPTGTNVMDAQIICIEKEV
jgi:glycerate-2-kinase